MWNISKTAYCRAKWKKNCGYNIWKILKWLFLADLGCTCMQCNLCMGMVRYFALCRGSPALPSGRKLSFISTLWFRERLLVYVELCQWPRCMPKYGNFENQWTQVLYWYLWSFSVQGHFGVLWCTCLEMTCNSKTGVRREKRSVIWEGGGGCVCTCKHVYGVPFTFLYKVIWGLWACRETDDYKNKLELQKTRYFTSGTCPLTMELNWMSGEVVKHHE